MVSESLNFKGFPLSQSQGKTFKLREAHHSLEKYTSQTSYHSCCATKHTLTWIAHKLCLRPWHATASVFLMWPMFSLVSDCKQHKHIPLSHANKVFFISLIRNIVFQLRNTFFSKYGQQSYKLNVAIHISHLILIFTLILIIVLSL